MSNREDRAWMVVIVCILVIAILSLASCDMLPSAPRQAERFTPPADWRATYDSVARCAGKQFTSHYDRVNWYVVAGFSFDTRDGEAIGYWYGDNIFLAEWLVYPERSIEAWDRYHPSEQQTIRETGRGRMRHESLHHALQHDGHPIPPFGGVCAT